MKVVDRMLGLIGLEMDDPEELDQHQADNKEDWQNEPKTKKASVVSLATQKVLKMMIVKPSAYDEVQEIADHLKNRRPIIVNLEDTEKELAQRIVDFISGTTYAINGNLQKVSAGIFVFAPPNVDLQGADQTDKERNFLSWGR